MPVEMDISIDEIVSMISLVPLNRKPEIIAGVDVAYRGNIGFCAVVVMTYRSLDIIETKIIKKEVNTPYIPGYLFLREGPIICSAIASIKTVPDVVLIDGQGIAHPRGAGIASYIGVKTGIPTIGCAKSRLIGQYKEPSPARGAFSPLVYNKKVVGAVVRTREGVKPVFVSAGHLITLQEAVEIVLSCSGQYRLPEPLRKADLLCKKTKREV